MIRPLNMMPGTPGRGSAELAPGRRPQAAGGAGDRPAVHGRRTTTRSARSKASSPSMRSAPRCRRSWSTSMPRRPARRWRSRIWPTGGHPLVVGTHTHVPTADARILPGGTAYITDVGMTGDYDSVIGMDKAVSLQRFRSHVPGARNTPALGEATLCAVYLRDRRPHRPGPHDRAPAHRRPARSRDAGRALTRPIVAEVAIAAHLPALAELPADDAVTSSGETDMAAALAPAGAPR